MIFVTPRLCLLVAAVLAASPSAVFARHSGRVAIAFSPDGTQFVSADDHEVMVWDALQRKSLRTFSVEKSQAIVFLSDGRLGVAGTYRNLQILDLASGRVIQELKLGDNVESLAIPADGRTVLLGFDDRSAQLWDLASGQPIRSFSVSEGSYSVAISRDGRQALFRDRKDVVALWETATGQQIRTLRDKVTSSTTITFSPDGKTALVGARLYDLASGSVVRQFGDSDYTHLSTLSRDGQLVLTARSNDLKSWEAATGRLLHSFPNQRHSIDSLALAPDNSLAVTGSYGGQVMLWDVTNGRMIATFESSSDAFIRYFMTFFSAIVALIIWALTLSLWRTHQIERQTKDWPTARGHILSSEVVTDEWTEAAGLLTSLASLFTSQYIPRGASYLPRIHYSYSVADKTYYSDRLHFAPRKLYFNDAEEAIEPYPPGTEVTVHYMPLDPSIAVLRTDENLRLYIFFALAIVVTAVTVMYMYVS